MRSAACEVKEKLLVLSVQLAIDRPEELNLLVILCDILVVGHLLDETNVIVVFVRLFFDYIHHVMPVHVVQIDVKIPKGSFHTLLDVVHLDVEQTLQRESFHGVRAFLYMFLQHSRQSQP